MTTISEHSTLFTSQSTCSTSSLLEKTTFGTGTSIGIGSTIYTIYQMFEIAKTAPIPKDNWMTLAISVALFGVSSFALYKASSYPQSPDQSLSNITILDENANSVDDSTKIAQKIKRLATLVNNSDSGIFITTTMELSSSIQASNTTTDETLAQLGMLEQFIAFQNKVLIASKKLEDKTKEASSKIEQKTLNLSDTVTKQSKKIENLNIKIKETEEKVKTLTNSIVEKGDEIDLYQNKIRFQTEQMVALQQCVEEYLGIDLTAEDYEESPEEILQNLLNNLREMHEILINLTSEATFSGFNSTSTTASNTRPGSSLNSTPTTPVKQIGTPLTPRKALARTLAPPAFKLKITFPNDSKTDDREDNT